MQLAKARAGVAGIGWGFRPTEQGAEPEGHPFDGRIGSAQMLRFATTPGGHAPAASAADVPRTEVREGIVHVFSGASGMEQGISGGPIYDPELRAVVGIFRAVEGGTWPTSSRSRRPSRGGRISPT